MKIDGDYFMQNPIFYFMDDWGNVPSRLGKAPKMSVSEEGVAMVLTLILWPSGFMSNRRLLLVDLNRRGDPNFQPKKNHPN